MCIEETLSDVHHRAHPTNQLTKGQRGISNRESVISRFGAHNLRALKTMPLSMTQVFGSKGYSVCVFCKELVSRCDQKMPSEKGRKN